jgi:predicted PurR-regulated permease PerM
VALDTTDQLAARPSSADASSNDPARPPRSGAAESTFDRAKPIALALILTLAAVMGVRLLVELRTVLVLLFVAILFAAALSRPAAILERRGVPRGLAVAFVQALGILIVSATLWFVVPPLVGQLASFAERLPSYVTRVHQLRGRYDAVRQHYPELRTFDTQISDLEGRLVGNLGGRLVDLPTTSASLVFDLVTIYVLATLMVMRRERILEAFLVLVAPDKRTQTRGVIEKIWWRLGGYLRAKAIVMLVVGALMYVALLVLGVPFAVPLAIIVAFGELVPVIGPWIGRIPLLTIAAFQGWETLGLTFLASVIIEDLKAYVISPRIQGQQLNIDPLLVVIAVLVGSALMGAPGAFISVPFAAMLQVIYEEVVLPWRIGRIGTADDATAEEQALGDGVSAPTG